MIHIVVSKKHCVQVDIYFSFNFIDADIVLLFQDGTHALWILLVGSWIPRSLFGYFHAVLANLRCVYMTVRIVFDIDFGEY